MQLDVRVVEFINVNVIAFVAQRIALEVEPSSGLICVFVLVLARFGSGDR
jgi:hypothetical protein